MKDKTVKWFTALIVIAALFFIFKGLGVLDEPTIPPNEEQPTPINTTPPATITCSDSDFGQDYYKKGICIDNTGTYTDYCPTTTSMVEYQCLNNVCIIKSFSGFSCSNGVRV